MQTQLFSIFLGTLIATSALAANSAPRKISRKTASANADISFEALDALNRAKCGSEALATLGKWHIAREWIRGPSDMDGGKVFKTPTEKMGVWAEVIIYPAGAPELMLVSSKTVLRTSWKEKDCAPQGGLQHVQAPPKNAQGFFSDSDLAELANQGAEALIYLWTPQMPLSVKGFHEAKAVAERLKLRFIPLLAPDSDAKYSIQEAKAAGIPSEALKQPDSVELAERGMLSHYPSTLVFRKGRFGINYPGYWDDVKTLESFVEGSAR